MPEFEFPVLDDSIYDELDGELDAGKTSDGSYGVLWFVIALLMLSVVVIFVIW